MNRQHLQDTYLNYLRREQLPVTVYLINGFQLKGLVRAFDSFTVVLDQDGRQMLVYKHALSTISPSRPVPLQVLASAGVQAGNESAGPTAPQDRPDSMASIPPHHRPG